MDDVLALSSIFARLMTLTSQVLSEEDLEGSSSLALVAEESKGTTCCDLFHTSPHYEWGPSVFAF